jgi:hypothetical protein
MTNIFATYQKLAPSLHFPPFFNYSQLLFVMCFLIHEKFIDNYFLKHIFKNYFKVDMHMCLDITRQFFFENTWTRGYHVSKFMGKVFLFLFNRKTTIC